MRFRIVVPALALLFAAQVLPAAEKKSVVQTHGGCAYEIIHTGGISDGYTLPTEQRHPSPAVAVFLHQLDKENKKDYDDTRPNLQFGDSFKLDTCTICDQLCGAKLVIEMQGNDILACNDTMFVGKFGGTALFNGPINPALCVDGASYPVLEYARWDEVIQDAVVRSIDLDVKKLQDLVCIEGYEFLDVVVQDDHSVDSMRLIIQH